MPDLIACFVEGTGRGIDEENEKEREGRGSRKTKRAVEELQTCGRPRPRWTQLVRGILCGLLWALGTGLWPVGAAAWAEGGANRVKIRIL
jgi:hypothetical protein